MKYLSLVILLGLMIWSWNLATAQQSFTLEQHKQVEAGVEDDVRGFIVRKYPETSDIYCQQLYTEVVKPNEEMIARFRCRAEGAASGGEKVQQTFEGFIRLGSNDGFQSWNELGGEIRSPEVVFQNGSRISTKDPVASDVGADKASETAPSAAPAAVPAATPATHEDEHAH